MLAKHGKLEGYLIEGMGCPGGCIAGAGTIAPIQRSKMALKKLVDSSTKLPPKELGEVVLD